MLDSVKTQDYKSNQGERRRHTTTTQVRELGVSDSLREKEKDFFLSQEEKRSRDSSRSEFRSCWEELVEAVQGVQQKGEAVHIHAFSPTWYLSKKGVPPLGSFPCVMLWTSYKVGRFLCVCVVFDPLSCHK
jgi:hypothetical protein